tara:strand:+ start:140 stop:427 length:288 start_codon:yes stop_codon:yes gene_type:complete
MEEKELNKKLNLVVNTMFQIGSSQHTEGTPLQGIFLALSTAIMSTGSENYDDEDVRQASIDLIDALGSVVNCSRLIREVQMKNEINDLMGGGEDK